MPSAVDVNWQEIHAQAVELLSEYIRINTTNPPGGEEAGALFLRGLLESEGIPCRMHDAGDSRVSISARLEGSGGSETSPLVLLSHIDVVPAEAEHWDVDPLSGAVVDGTIGGRGALDMKCMGIMELLVMVLARRHRLPLKQDLVFVAVADEEEGGLMGVHYLEREAPELLRSSWIFNEGAYGFREFMGKPTRMFGVAPSEKSPCWIRLRTHGEPGHGSVPHSKNSLVALVKALARIEEREKRARLTAPVEAMLNTLKGQGFLPDDLDPRDDATLEALGELDPFLHAITHDTVTLTGVHAGSKHNVIPVNSESTLDCRLLPGTNPDDFVEELRSVIDDPGVELELVLQHDSGQSSMDTPVTQVIGEVLEERYGNDVCVLPMLSPGFTDSHAFRKAGGHAYGFTPALLSREELSTIHGHNERLSVENLALGTELLFEVTRRLACSGPSAR